MRSSHVSATRGRIACSHACVVKLVCFDIAHDVLVVVELASHLEHSHRMVMLVCCSVDVAEVVETLVYCSLDTEVEEMLVDDTVEEEVEVMVFCLA